MVDAGIATVSVAAKFTMAPQCPSSLLTVILEGQTICGARPVTVTVNEHCAAFPEASVTVCVTVVIPMGNVEPLAKPAVKVVVEPGQLSVPTGAI